MVSPFSVTDLVMDLAITRIPCPTSLPPCSALGEGLKLGALALIRSGRRVVMCTGEERWRFAIAENKGLKEKVLTVFIKRE